MQHSKNRIRKKRVVCIKYTWRKGEERGAGESLLLFLFPGDSKGEDRCDGGHSAVVSGMCFVHVLFGCPVTNLVLYSRIPKGDNAFKREERLKSV